MTEVPPPGYPPQQPVGQAPNNYLVWAILTTLFCFPITGIVAIVKAASVNGLWAQGLHADALAAAASAKKWVLWTVAIGILGYIVYGIYIATLVANAPDANAAMVAASLF